MDSPLPSSSPAHGGGEPAAGGARKEMEAPPQVDSFLVEVLENPRHRLTVLRMELDIQRFMQNPDQYQFEFHHFPSSYLRRAAHRVAQHYGLQTIVLDNILDGRGRIIVRKTPESRYPVVCLSDVPAKKPEDEKPGKVNIVIRPRPIKASSNGVIDEVKQLSLRTMEEREEEYDKARARIFSGSNSPEVGVSSQVVADSESLCSYALETECNRKILEEPEKTAVKDGSSRVAIFKDREKDRSDPDYDRSYQRYFRGPAPDQNYSLGLYHVLQPSYMQYESGFPQLTQMQRTQASACYKPSNHIMSSYYTAGCNQTSRDAVYVPWPSPAMMYAHSYEHFRNTILQAPFYQQPLSFEHRRKC